jgi:hypothetical protein
MDLLVVIFPTFQMFSSKHFEEVHNKALYTILRQYRNQNCACGAYGGGERCAQGAGGEA